MFGLLKKKVSEVLPSRQIYKSETGQSLIKVLFNKGIKITALGSTETEITKMGRRCFQMARSIPFTIRLNKIKHI